jgi:hypothetical protein
MASEKTMKPKRFELPAEADAAISAATDALADRRRALQAIEAAKARTADLRQALAQAEAAVDRAESDLALAATPTEQLTKTANAARLEASAAALAFTRGERAEAAVAARLPDFDGPIVEAASRLAEQKLALRGALRWQFVDELTRVVEQLGAVMAKGYAAVSVCGDDEILFALQKTYIPQPFSTLALIDRGRKLRSDGCYVSLASSAQEFPGAAELVDGTGGLLEAERSIAVELHRVRREEANLPRTEPAAPPVQAIGLVNVMVNGAVQSSGPSVSRPIDEFAMPPESELRTLHAQVMHYHPELWARSDGMRQETADREHFLHFALAYHRIGQLRRTDEVDLKRDAHDWRDDTVKWATHTGHGPVQITTPAFIAAAYAFPDVKVVTNGRPTGTFFNLSTHTGRFSGRLA